MTISNPQYDQRVQAYYQDIIREIMTEHDLEPRRSYPIVSSNATFEEVLLHTDWYVHAGDDARPNGRPHYRYRRYIEVLKRITPPKSIAHVDIGCGAGVFSWPLLDWAMEKGIARDSVDLYGFDHSEEMIRLAGVIRERLAQKILDYPCAHYSYRPRHFLEELQNRHREDRRYVITLGHVIAQTIEYAPSDIDNFAQIIVGICRLMNAGRRCALIAVDAQGSSIKFVEGWNKLLCNIEASGIRYEQYTVPKTSINDDNRAKIAMISPT